MKLTSLRLPKFFYLLASLLVVPAACNSRPAPPSGERVALLDTAATTRAATSAPATAPASPEAAAMKEAVDYLASDELEGRGLDTQGLNLAAAYIAGNFHGAGLRPLPGLSGYFQPFDWTTADGFAAETSLVVNGKKLQAGEDFNPLSDSAERAFDGPAVFVGYGITSSKLHYDDYADVDVKGKVAVAWRFEPVDEKGKSKFGKSGNWSELAHFETKAKTAAEHGATALVLVNPPLYKSIDVLVPMVPRFTGSARPIPMVHVKRGVGNALITGAEGDAAATAARALEAQIDADPSPHSRVLPGATVSGRVAMRRAVHHLKNVVGYLAGTGPHADEYVVVGAHYDHLGRGGFGSLAPQSHEIHHGADDNASGTAAVLELAREFGERARAGETFPRSILFATFTAEEEALIGSGHFVEHCPVSLGQIVAMLNLDMVGRMKDRQLFVGGFGTAPSLKGILDDAAKGLPIERKDSGEGGLGPSDHMSFAQKKIPVLFFWTNTHEDYHRPTDTSSKVNFNGMADVVKLSARVIDRLAAMPKEQYVSAADKHSMTFGIGSGSGTGGERRATLGVVPSYGEASPVKGAKINGTVADSPAERAGLLEGDVIVGFNDKTIDDLMDLSNALAGAEPGDRVKVTVLRDGKRMTLQATLAERK